MAEQSKRVPFWRSLQTKFALTYVVIIAAVLILLNTYPVLVSQDLVYQSKQASLQNQAAVLASALSMGPEELTRETVKGTIDRLGVPGTTRVVVTDPAGEVLCDWYEGAYQEDTLGRYALFWEVAAALQGNDVFRSEYREGAFRSRAAVPVTYRSMTLGAVYFYEYDTEQGALLLGIQSNLRSMSAVICVVTLIMSVFFSKALTRRIAALLRAIRIVRQGEYSHRVDLKGGDEMTQLAEEFNELTGRLQTTEEVRRRFVSDASHELKTPLASIRLLTDSILQDENIDQATTREFVADIGEAADRLIRISQELLELNRLDEGRTLLREPVDLNAQVEKAVRLLQPLAESAQVTLETDLGEDCTVLCNTEDAIQILRNLMENAIKYNVPQGKVWVTTRRVGDRVRLEVADTGVGIPQEDMPKIFQRFYRVDKARSRAAGGTGLGLSIVRDAVRRHGGEITVAPRTSAGVVFTVLLLAEEGGAPS